MEEEKDEHAITVKTFLAAKEGRRWRRRHHEEAQKE
jgi:hypothetical protein